MTQETAEKSTSQPFQAEVAELLKLMVHSVYSETEIFLRELISNASDACDKLRYEAIKKPDLVGDAGPPVIRVIPNEEAGTLTIADTESAIDRGIMLNMLLDNNKVVFEANQKIARDAGLTLNAKLLRLATKVHQ